MAHFVGSDGKVEFSSDGGKTWHELGRAIVHEFIEKRKASTLYVDFSEDGRRALLKLSGNASILCVTLNEPFEFARRDYSLSCAKVETDLVEAVAWLTGVG